MPDEIHSAKHVTLGKERVSGQALQIGQSCMAALWCGTAVEKFFLSALVNVMLR
jgi:hypothetical protein